MTVSFSTRSSLREEFRSAYWNRAVELGDLTAGRERQRLIEEASTTSLTRPLRKAFRAKLRAREIDLLTIEDISAIARRFALLSLRQAHEWGRPDRCPPNTSDVVRRIDHDLRTGVWTLDVVLRRAAETVARDGPNERRARELRGLIDLQVDRLATSIDAAHHELAGRTMPRVWSDIADLFDSARSGFDSLLKAAGARPAQHDEPLGVDARTS